MSNRETQRTRILDLLRSHEGEWVPLSEILDLRIGQYNARVFELRRLGFVIDNRTERDDSGAVRSWFRLVTPQGDWFTEATGNPRAAAAQTRPDDLPLFSRRP